ncbi:MAG: FCD domain-containing protein [Eubacteriales bacterium]
MKKQDGLKQNFIHMMQQKLFSGEYQIGQPLPSERELAAQLGVSRSLVNSGILELAKQGFVEIMPRRGSIVADYIKNGTLPVLGALMGSDSFRLNYPMFCDLIDMYILIECECARLASQVASLTQLSQLRQLVEQIRDAKSPLDAVAPVIRFHQLLIQFSGNAVYVMVFKSFDALISQSIHQHFSLAPDLPRTVKLHCSLVRSLEAREPEPSAQNAKLCILHGTNILKKQYQI